VTLLLTLLVGGGRCLVRVVAPTKRGL